MDSLTQLALGSTVAVAVAGRRIGPRRAALVGAVLGTVPDLDVFIPFGNPVDDFVLHRGASHSLLVQAVVTPLFAEPLRWMFSALREERWRVYLLVYLVFATHALIDAMTVYGTRIFWPLWPDPVGVGSVFIIDPLYSVPLLVILVWALFLGRWTLQFGKVVTWGLVLSTGYMAWSAGIQQVVLARAETALVRAGIAVEQVMATPTPFNTFYWRAIAITDTDYVNLYVPVLGGTGELTAYAHPRGGHLLGCIGTVEQAGVLADFSDGFFKLEERDGRLTVTDLRIGLTPFYVFSFEVAERQDGVLEAIPSVRRPVERDIKGDLDWLWAGIAGEGIERPIEAADAISVEPQAPIRVAGPTAHSPSACSPG